MHDAKVLIGRLSSLSFVHLVKLLLQRRVEAGGRRLRPELSIFETVR